MTLFIATLLATLVCCGLMGIGLLLRGRPLEGGCGKTPPWLERCAGCPNRGRPKPAECPGQGDH